MHAVDKDGVSYKDTLKGLLKRARDPKRRAQYKADLECPPLPEAAEHIWRAFQRLSRRRGSGGMGASTLTWPDIDAFVRQSRLRLAPWEIEMIEDLEDLWMAERAREIKALRGGGS